MAEDLDLKLLTVASTRIAVQERQITATALVEAFYKKIEGEDRRPGQVNAYLTLTRERALGQANKLDEIADRGDPLPPLGGVPARAWRLQRRLCRFSRCGHSGCGVGL